tara:strand:- start:1030 stop:1233 length:204 start_codon:yes stop_codon:yes gene_type:complete
MTNKYFSKLTPFEKAEYNAQDFAYKMYESLVISEYMLSGSLPVSEKAPAPTQFSPSGSQNTTDSKAA